MGKQRGAMLLNAETVVRLENSDCMLVPHLHLGWMADEELRRLKRNTKTQTSENNSHSLFTTCAGVLVATLMFTPNWEFTTQLGRPDTARHMTS